MDRARSTPILFLCRAYRSSLPSLTVTPNLPEISYNRRVSSPPLSTRQCRSRFPPKTTWRRTQHMQWTNTILAETTENEYITIFARGSKSNWSREDNQPSVSQLRSTMASISSNQPASRHGRLVSAAPPRTTQHKITTLSPNRRHLWQYAGQIFSREQHADTKRCLELAKVKAAKPFPPNSEPSGATLANRNLPRSAPSSPGKPDYTKRPVGPKHPLPFPYLRTETRTRHQGRTRRLKARVRHPRPPHLRPRFHRLIYSPLTLTANAQAVGLSSTSSNTAHAMQELQPPHLSLSPRKAAGTPEVTKACFKPPLEEAFGPGCPLNTPTD